MLIQVKFLNKAVIIDGVVYQKVEEQHEPYIKLVELLDKIDNYGRQPALLSDDKILVELPWGNTNIFIELVQKLDLWTREFVYWGIVTKSEEIEMGQLLLKRYKVQPRSG